MPRLSVASALRIGCGLLLIGWLLSQDSVGEMLSELRRDPPDALTLLAAWGVVAAAAVISMMRWRCVVRAAGVDLSALEALRLGSLGFACNFIALGSVGGDVVKVAVLARDRPGKRAAVVTTIIVDRLFGMLGFLSYAALAILLTGTASSDDGVLRVLSQSTLAVAAVAWVCLALVLAPGRLLERIAGSLAGLPVVGAIAAKGSELAAAYHDGRGHLVQALACGLLMNGVFVMSFYVAARSLPLAIPGLADHYLIVPLTAISGTLPISPNGLGTIEATAEYLYRATAPGVREGAGTLAAIAHRLAMMATGVLGAFFYTLSSGRRIDEAMSQAEQDNAISEADGSGTAVETA